MRQVAEVHRHVAGVVRVGFQEGVLDAFYPGAVVHSAAVNGGSCGVERQGEGTYRLTCQSAATVRPALCCL